MNKYEMIFASIIMVDFILAITVVPLGIIMLLMA